MSTWMRCNLGDATLAAEKLELVKALVGAEPSAEAGAVAAAFFRHESEGRLHCEVWVYFTPGAAAVARTVGAGPCPPPAADGLSLLAGAPEAWTILE